jgi:hypothetical protein
VLAPAVIRALLVAAILVQLLVMPFKPAGATVTTVPMVSQRPFDAGLAMAVVAVALIGFARRRALVLSGFVLLLATFVAIGIWKIRTAPQPRIDVFVFHVEAARALADGVNPYAITFPNIYEPETWNYGPGVVRDGRLQFGFPYPPLVLVFTAPAQLLLGDFRYAYLLAMVASAGMLAKLAPGRLAMLAASMFPLTPRAFYVLELGWTEPFSVMLLTATTLCAIRAPKVMPVMLGLLITSKQYLPAALALVPLLVETPGRRLQVIRTVVIALVVAFLVTAPLALWDLRAFWHSTVLLQFRQPYRFDALSFLAWWGAGRQGWVGPFWPCFLMLAIMVALCLWRAERGALGFVSSFALCFISFFAFNKQAFANYYYLVIGALCCAAALASARSGKLHSAEAVSR